MNIPQVIMNGQAVAVAYISWGATVLRQDDTQKMCWQIYIFSGIVTKSAVTGSKNNKHFHILKFKKTTAN